VEEEEEEEEDEDEPLLETERGSSLKRISLSNG